MMSSSVQLVNREVISVGSNTAINNKVTAATTASKKSSFSVMQFNILADALSDSFPKADQKILAWSYREPLILEEITRRLPTVVCIEECDHFDDMKTQLKSFGYQGFFVKKKSDFSQDGCAMFYRTDDVECLSYREAGLGGTQVALLAQFVLKKEETTSIAPSSEECKAEDTSSSSPLPKPFFVAMTHLKAKVGFEEQRLRQVEALMKAISQYMSEDGPSINFKGEDVSKIPLVIAGDFNEVPEGPAIQYMLKKSHFQPQDGLTLASSYTSHPTSEELPYYTTCKFRKDLVKRTIDYIFYNPKVFTVERAYSVSHLTIWPYSQITFPVTPTLATTSPLKQPSHYYSSTIIVVIPSGIPVASNSNTTIYGQWYWYANGVSFACEILASTWCRRQWESFRKKTASPLAHSLVGHCRPTLARWGSTNRFFGIENGLMIELLRSMLANFPAAGTSHIHRKRSALGITLKLDEMTTTCWYNSTIFRPKLKIYMDIRLESVQYFRDSTRLATE